MALKNRENVKVTAKNKAKLTLAEYLDKFDLEKDCWDYADFKGSQAGKVKEQIDKIVERMRKALVIK